MSPKAMLLAAMVMLFFLLISYIKFRQALASGAFAAFKLLYSSQVPKRVNHALCDLDHTPVNQCRHLSKSTMYGSIEGRNISLPESQIR